ncbi:hypothetical protein [Demequina muriae]|uniref:Uncharacterized protein n=1 Tax=Demequina muriae TaxID=3051664 RepID=A0ABT8GGK3_9MICO|nr:hypothetical protein [Demequina sp. EGI L300058]MDN4480547.1 hypothetical protein [Demequina sp. EGI L300058]
MFVYLPRAGVDKWGALRRLVAVLTVGLATILGGFVGFIDPAIGRPTPWTQTVLPVLAILVLALLLVVVAVRLRSLRLMPLLILTIDAQGESVLRTSLISKVVALTPARRGRLKVVLRELVLPHRTLRGSVRDVYHFQLTLDNGEGSPLTIAIANYTREYDWNAWLERVFERIGVPADIEVVRAPS